ncbi:MAG: TIGR02099 family protein [Gammaproteobacteria bacterium]|nr:TIGR02099 family protein [Gammaproteobacteria bacterium]
MKLKLRFNLSRLLRPLRRLGRYGAYAGLSLFLLFAVAYGIGRYYWPEILARQGDIAARISEKAKHIVRAERIEPYWDKLHPGVRFAGVTVLGDDGRPSVQIDEIRVSFSLLPLLWKQMELHSLVLQRPRVTFMRLADGQVRLAGFTPVANAAPSKDKFSDWLLSQRQLEVENGELRWVDARDPAGSLSLSQVDLQLRNSFGRHKFYATAQFPAALCRRGAVRAQIAGDPFIGSWDGALKVEASGLNIGRLPMLLRERLPTDLRGRVDAELRSDWRAGRLQAVSGEATVAELTLPWPNLPQPLNVRQASAKIDWELEKNGWSLDLARLNLALNGNAWSAGRLQLNETPDEHRLRVKHLNLGDISEFIAGLKLEQPLAQRWLALRPEGSLDNVRLQLNGPLTAPTALDVGAQFARVRIAPYKEFPGFRNVSGRLSAGLTAGEFALDASNVVIDYPNLFRAPLATRYTSGMLHWQRTDDAWHMSGDNLRVQSADANGSGAVEVELPHDRTQSPALRLQVEFKNGNGKNAARYYPTRHLQPSLRTWLESSIQDGHIVSGRLLYDGRVHDWPFAQGQGRFEVQAHIEDGVYRYHPGWAPATNVDADVTVTGSHVVVTGRAQIGVLQTNNLHVELQRPTVASPYEASLHGRLEGPVAEAVRLLQTASPTNANWQPYVREIAQASGDGALDLDLRIPLGQHQPAWHGEYRFTDTALKVASGAGLAQANGAVRFTETGIEGGHLQGQFLGGPITLSAARGDGELRAHAEGQLQLPELLRSRRALAERVGGGIDWSLDWRDIAQGPQFRFSSNLTQVRTRLPPPLNRPDGGFPAQLIVATERSDANQFVLAMQAGTEASGKLVYTRAEDRWQFVNGRIEFGRSSATLPDQPGLQIGLKADVLDIDEWLPFLSGGGGKGGGEAEAGLPRVIAWVTADVRQLGFFDRRWGRMLAQFMRSGADEWHAVLDGENAAGDGSFVLARAGGFSRVQLDLAHLRVPEKQHTVGAGGEGASTVDPHRLPALNVRSRAFEFDEHQLGELDFNALPSAQGWRIERFNLKRPEMQLAINGDWRRIGDRQSSEFSGVLESDDMGRTLTALGASTQMADGKVKLTAKAAWPGSPSSPTLAALNGSLQIKAEKGRFLNLNPGAARWFGVLDLRSIGRYLTLDFSPAFGKGYTFDEINGTVAVASGNANTNDLWMKGPALSLAVKGRVGLVTEDYDLVVEATPKVGNAVVLPGWYLLGPQAAAAIFAIQKLFKRQIQEGSRVFYVIQGPWASPTVTKLGKPEAQPTAKPEPTMPGGNLKGR